MQKIDKVVLGVLWAVSMPFASLSGNLTKVELYGGMGTFERQIILEDLGDQEVVYIRNLPRSILGDSLRIDFPDSRGVWASQIQFRLLDPDELDKSEEIRRLEKEIREMEAELEAVEWSMNATEDRLRFLDQLIEAFSEGVGNSGELNLEAFGELVAKREQEMRTLQRDRTASFEQRESLEAAIDAKEVELDEAGRRQFQLAGELGFRLSSEVPGNLRVRLRGQFRGARWEPSYSISGDLAGGSVLLESQARIFNQTGEDWEDIELVLLTGNLNHGTEARDPSALVLDRPRPQPAYRSKGMTKFAAPQAESSIMSDALAAAPPPVVERVGTQVAIRAPGLVSVRDAREGEIIQLASAEVPSTFVVKTSPAVSTEAYLHATFENPLEYPLLAGPVRLHLDGAFTGRTRVGEFQPNEEIELGLGNFPALEVERRSEIIPRETNGIFGKTRRMERKYVTILRNTGDDPVEVVVVDRFPLSRDEAIKILFQEPSNPDLDPETGIFERRRDLQSGSSVELVTQFRVEVPADWEIGNSWLPY